MRMLDAINTIYTKQIGFMVDFEWFGDGFLRSDHFPDKHAGEPLISTEEQAWELAGKFAQANKGRVCNVYVTKSDFTPVDGYEEKRIVNR